MARRRKNQKRAILDKTDPKLLAMRYPSIDNAFIDVLKVAFVEDAEGYCMALYKSFTAAEIGVDIVRFGDNIATYVLEEKPDVLVVNNSDRCDPKGLVKLIFELDRENAKMPFLVYISPERSVYVHIACQKFPGMIQLYPPFNAARKAKELESFLLTHMLGEALVREKIRCAAYEALSAMHCPDFLIGSKFMMEAVVMVTLEPYRRFRFKKDIFQVLADAHDTPTVVVEKAMTRCYERALKAESQVAESVLFKIYDGKPTLEEFIHSAAFLTAQRCRRLLRHLEDQPFCRPKRKYMHNRSSVSEEEFLKEILDYTDRYNIKWSETGEKR